VKPFAVLLLSVLLAGPVAAAEKSPRLPALSARQKQEYDALGYDPRKVHAVFTQLKAAFARKDFDAFARLVTFPLTINRPNAAAITVKDGQELKQQRALVFSPAIAAAVKRQAFQQLALRDEGALVGGVLLISGACTDGGDAPCAYGIVAVTAM
jgi:hypothetical protein